MGGVRAKGFAVLTPVVAVFAPALARYGAHVDSFATLFVDVISLAIIVFVLVVSAGMIHSGRSST